MSTANARIPVLVTTAEKKRIVKRAQQAGISTGEYMRRAAEFYRPSNDEKALEAMIEQMIKATENAERAIDDAVSFVEESNRRITKMEAKR